MVTLTTLRAGEKSCVAVATFIESFDSRLLSFDNWYLKSQKLSIASLRCLMWPFLARFVEPFNYTFTHDYILLFYEYVLLVKIFLIY